MEIGGQATQSPWLVDARYSLLHELGTMGLLRAKDVAEILACSRSEVYTLKDAGKLRFCKIGGMVRFRREDVDQLIADSMALPAQSHVQHHGSQALKHLHLE
jgi:excisionase family DNA binding protein